MSEVIQKPLPPCGKECVDLPSNHIPFGSCEVEVPPYLTTDLRAKLSAYFGKATPDKPTNMISCEEGCFVCVEIDLSACESPLKYLLAGFWCVCLSFRSSSGAIVETMFRDCCAFNSCESQVWRIGFDIEGGTFKCDADHCGQTFTAVVTVMTKNCKNVVIPFLYGECISDPIFVYPGPDFESFRNKESAAIPAS